MAMRVRVRIPLNFNFNNGVIQDIFVTVSNCDFCDLGYFCYVALSSILTIYEACDVYAGSGDSSLALPRC